MPIASPKRSQALVLPCRAPPGSRLYAVGDIHGRSDLLDRLHEAIAADARHCGAERVRIVYLGDYVDRGGDSAGVIERLVRPPPDGPRRVFLMGNHEAMMLAFLDGDLAQLDSWLWNGGMATLESYGVYPMAGEQGPGWAEAIRADLLKALPPAHAEFLRALQSHHRAGDLFFVHAGIRPGVPLNEQDRTEMMWIREEFLGSPADFGALVVHGHTVVPAPDMRANRIGIDTGAYKSGRLTAAVFEGDTAAFLTT